MVYSSRGLDAQKKDGEELCVTVRHCSTCQSTSVNLPCTNGLLWVKLTCACHVADRWAETSTAVSTTGMAKPLLVASSPHRLVTLACT
eukprot:m.802087 g.802087  ORF g.802087 m.802087 type:complete len:88 (-) comp23361_c1_seq39:1453-1716(-)